MRRSKRVLGKLNEHGQRSRFASSAIFSFTPLREVLEGEALEVLVRWGQVSEVLARSVKKLRKKTVSFFFIYYFIYYFMSLFIILFIILCLGLLATSEEAGLYIIVKRGTFQIK